MDDTTVYIVYPEWETVKLIGSGGFGAVYEIEHDVLGHMEKAALKVITIPHDRSEIEVLKSAGYDAESITLHFKDCLQDIVREYSMMADLKGCVNIVYSDNVRFVQHEDGIGWDIFIKMELLTPLTGSIAKMIPDEQVIRIGKDLCSALAFCEKHNILHRDIKPQNIFVSADGTYKLGDFGVAKVSDHTTSDALTGTYDYMAPEVYNHQPYGFKADICSLGLVMYWLLNEQITPFLPLSTKVPSYSEKLEARQKRFSGKQIPPPMHGCEELKKIVLKACAFDPKDRYQTADEMLNDLQSIGKRDTPPSPADVVICPVCGTKAEIGTKFCQACGAPLDPPKPKKKRGLIISLAVMVLVMIIGMLFLFRPALHDPAPIESSHRHTWSEWTVETQPGCENTGTEVRICADDSEHKEWRQIPALGHDWADATYDTPKTCRRCGATEGEPLKRHPGPEDLKGYTDIKAPNDSWLLDYEVKYVKTKYGNSAYLRNAPDNSAIERSKTVKEGEEVTVLARENGFSLVKTKDERLGWVKSDLLVDEYK